MIKGQCGIKKIIPFGFAIIASFSFSFKSAAILFALFMAEIILVIAVCIWVRESEVDFFYWLLGFERWFH